MKQKRRNRRSHQTQRIPLVFITKSDLQANASGSHTARIVPPEKGLVNKFLWSVPTSIATSGVPQGVNNEFTVSPHVIQNL